jgi:azurin
MSSPSFFVYGKPLAWLAIGGHLFYYTATAMHTSKFLAGTMLATMVLLSACAGGGGSETAEITIRPVGDTMEYETTEFTVSPGQQVHLVFENTATSAAMRHNVVVVNSTAAADSVGTAALMMPPDSDYIPESSSIIAHTPLSSPGETVEVTFTAPEQPGTYPYLCTFPGHYITMRGQMIVQ